MTLPSWCCATCSTGSCCVLGLLRSLLFLAALAAAYTLKRALKIDVVPGVDMLPDQEIEALINGALSMLGS